MSDKEEEDDEEKPEHFYRMTYLVINIGTDIVRQLFVKDIPIGQSVKAFLKNNERNIKLLERKHVFNDYQLNILNSSQPDVTKFDLSLLYILVSNISNIQPPSGGWKQALPLQHDMSPGALLIRLRTARNEIIAHSPSGKMSKSSFDKHWTVTSNMLIDLAGAVSEDVKKAVKEKVEETRTKPIGDEVYKQNTLVMWALQDRVGVMSSRLDELSQQKIATQESPTGSMETSVHTLQDQMARIHKEMATLNTTTGDHSKDTGSDVKKLKVDYEHLFQQQQEILTKLDKVNIKIEELSKTPQRILRPGEKEYDRKKLNLQKELIDHYRENPYCKMAIPALIKGRKTDVNEVFVMPSMRVVEPGTSKVSTNKDAGNQPKMIRSINGLFMANGEPIRKVYLQGEAGTGKTTLCRRMVSRWCTIHKGHQSEIESDDDDKFLKNIEVLFYIPLRNHKKSDIVEMIKMELLTHVFYDDLDLVLKNESRNCLIILDGLDEWWPSKGCSHKVPWINPTEKCFVLTTSRPWKLEILRPEMPNLGQVELWGLEEDTLIEAVVRLLNSRFGRDVNWRSFKYEYFTQPVKDDWVVNDTYKKIKHLSGIPVILTQIVCMWFDGEDIRETSRMHIFCQMVEYLLSVANKRHQEMEGPAPMMGPQRSTNADLVNLFKGYTLCETFSETLFKLSDLAYHTLISTKKEKSLVFPHAVTEMYKLTGNDVAFCLNVGLLSQSEFYGKAASDLKCISFLHKTFQELFAALFVAHCGNDRSHSNMLQTMKTLDNVFEMSEVLIFLSGLRPDLISDISRHIAELTDRDDRVLRHRNSLRYDMSIIERVQDLIFNCIVEAPTNRELDSKVELHDINLTFSPSIDKDWVLPCLNTENIKSLDINRNVSEWMKGIGHNIVRLYVRVESVKDMGPLVSVIKRCASSLSVVCVNFRPAMVIEINFNEKFLKALYKVSHLKCFKLIHTILNHSDLECLGRFLSTSTQLREINVDNITCRTCGQCDYTVDLSQHKRLQCLSIYGLGGDFILSGDTPLEDCWISEVKCAASIIHRLRSSTTLQELTVSGHWLPYDTFSTDSTTRAVENQGAAQSFPLSLSKVVTQVTPTLKNLRKLVLSSIDFKQDMLRLSPEMANLKIVGLYGNNMMLQCVQGFIDTLPQTEHTVEMQGVAVYPTADVSSALKYITDRHQDTKPRCRTMFIDNGELYLSFTNRSFSC